MNKCQQYLVNRENTYLSVVDEQTGYKLQIFFTMREEDKWSSVTFFAPQDDYKMWVTARDWGHYDPEVRRLHIFPEYQYVEVGAGLGEFIPAVVHVRRTSAEPLPIVIDPVNYTVMREMLLFASVQNRDAQVRKRLEELAARCDSILDKNRVRLVSSKLGEALQKYPDLYGIADVVVDNAGPATHTNTEYLFEDSRVLCCQEDVIKFQQEREEAKKHVYNLERKLLKPTGILLSEYTWHEEDL